MKNTNQYKCLQNQVFEFEEFRIEPLGFEDRIKIMQWRNEQIYHLRQLKPLTSAEQDKYFSEVVARLFEQSKPLQILFSFLKADELIGYGGLVHINWRDQHAEISFIMNTELEKEHFLDYWQIFLRLIEQPAFRELHFHKIFTYAYDLRPKLYEALEMSGYQREATLKAHVLFEGGFKDVVIHSKVNPLSMRRIQESDVKTIFHWANDPDTRRNSFNTDAINLKQHISWFGKKLRDSNAYYLIALWKGEEAGLVRFDLKTNDALIGINIAPNHRGKGLSAFILQMACQYFFAERASDSITAYIRQDNLASIRSFEKAGFNYVRKEKVEEQEALVYKLIKT